MLLKQSAKGNIQSNMIIKGLKVKHALQTCVVLALTIWMIYQLKLFIHNNEATVNLSNHTNLGLHTTISSDLSDRIQSVSVIDIKLLGRKALLPQEEEGKPWGSSDDEARINDSYEVQLTSDDEDLEEEREVDRMDDLIDENDRNDDEEEEGVVDEDDIDQWDKQIEEAKLTRDVDSEFGGNRDEVQTTMLMDT